MLFIDRHGEAAGAALNALARADYAARLENELSAAYGKSVAATSSVDAAIHTALRLCGVQSGDYVFVPTFTFYSYVATVAHTGAVPVFLDCDPTTRCVSAAALETALMWAELQGKPPAAVVADNAFGSIADFDVLAPLCKAWGAPLIELCCDAFGGEYNGRSCGGSGDYGVICCDKRLTGGGGAVVCGEDRSEAWEFARVKYTAGENHDYRINNFDAALWLEQRAVSEKLTARARKNLAALATSLDCVVPPDCTSSARRGSTLKSRRSSTLCRNTSSVIISSTSPTIPRAVRSTIAVLSEWIFPRLRGCGLRACSKRERDAT